MTQPRKIYNKNPNMPESIIIKQIITTLRPIEKDNSVVPKSKQIVMSKQNLENLPNEPYSANTSSKHP